MKKIYVTILGVCMILVLTGCSTQSSSGTQTSPIKERTTQYDTYEVEDVDGETREIRIEIEEPNYYERLDPSDYYRGY